MTSEKTCPKCQGTMKNDGVVCVIPAMLDDKWSRKTEAVSTKSGVPVTVNACSKCGFIELYHYEQ